MAAVRPAAEGGPSLTRSLLQLTDFWAVCEGSDNWDWAEDGAGGGGAATSGGGPASDFFLSARSTGGSMEAEGGNYKSGVKSLRLLRGIEYDDSARLLRAEVSKTLRGIPFPELYPGLR